MIFFLPRLLYYFWPLPIAIPKQEITAVAKPDLSNSSAYQIEQTNTIYSEIPRRTGTSTISQRTTRLHKLLKLAYTTVTGPKAIGQLLKHYVLIALLVSYCGFLKGYVLPSYVLPDHILYVWDRQRSRRPISFPHTHLASVFDNLEFEPELISSHFLQWI